ncbi:hypothetical protein [Treponema berlinense]|uniref:hypothetical protein n=1 Tax=Treponema berlinense TaxID=225004 RepID=UPI0026ED55C6|nr:hypothetical protein [Treponema berlinense]
MKTKSFFNGLAVFALALGFAGCSDLLQTKNSSAGNASAGKNVPGTGSFEISVDAGERYIAAVDYDVNKIESWTIVLKEKTEAGEEPVDPITLTCPTTGEAETSDSSISSVSYDKNSKTLHAQRIPSGKYDIKLEGTYTENGITVTLYGVKTGITVSSDSTKNSVKVLVGLKKTEGTTGDLSLGFTDKALSFEKYTLSPVVTLTKIGDASVVFSTTGDSPALNFAASEADATVWTLTGSSLEPGWYKIEFAVSGSGYTLRIPGDKTMVEIASGITTTATDIEISLISAKIYYATNDASAVNKNGLAASSRKNINALLKKLAEGLPAVQKVEIHMDDVPEIEVSALNGLAAALSKEDSEKQFVIYNKDGSSPVGFTMESMEDDEGNPYYEAKIGIAGSVVLLGSENDKVLTVSSFITSGIEVSIEDVYITLKNGASLNFGDGVELSTDNLLRLCADDFSSYSVKPIVKTCAAYEATNIMLYKTGATEKPTTEYTLIQKTNNDSTCSYYVKPASDKVFDAVTASDALTITAYYTITTEGESGETTEKITVSDPIPYDNADLTFEISGMDSEIENYYWYLNRKTLDTSNNPETATFTFNPHETAVEVDDVNTVSCYVSCGGVLYLKEYEFNFAKPSASAAVWMDSVSKSSSAQFMQVFAFDTGTPATIGDGANSKFYTFDDECTLWTASVKTENVSLSIASYPLLVSAGKYTTSNVVEVAEIDTTDIKDVCFDVKNKNLWVLAELEGYGYKVFKINRGDFYNTTDGAYNVSDTASVLASTTITQLAVDGDTFYFADSDCNVYVSDIIDFTKETTLNEGNLVKNLADTELLTGFDGTLYDSNGYDSLTVTDLQVGDGLGYDTDNLYVLVREYSDTLGYMTENNESGYSVQVSDNYFSRGALIKIDSERNCTLYGWWSDNENAYKLTPEGYSFTDTYYSPSAVSTSEFFGPVKFCAVAPKKLVVLDDGFIWSETENKLKNKDSLVEFDIEAETQPLTRKGAWISVSVPSASYYYLYKQDW